MASKALLVTALQTVCGEALAKSVDAEVVSYVSDVIEFHKPGDDLTSSVGAMLEDFIGEDNTRKLIAFVEAEKGGSVAAATGNTTLLSGPVGECDAHAQMRVVLDAQSFYSRAKSVMKGSFVSTTAKPISSAIVSFADDNDQEDNATTDGKERRKERKQAASVRTVHLPRVGVCCWPTRTRSLCICSHACGDRLRET